MIRSAFHRLFVTVLFICTLPVQIFIGCLVLLFTGAPVLFRQKRAGRNGKAFTIFKFRTMVAGAESRQASLRTRNEATGPVFKMYNDPRYTGIGRALAHTGLDELPQLVNVLRGEMSLFGPRPFPLSEERRLKPWQKNRERIKPGIFSPAIIGGTYHTDFAAWMKSDLAYAQEKSFRKDAVLFCRALGFVSSLLLRSVFGIL